MQILSRIGLFRLFALSAHCFIFRNLISLASTPPINIPWNPAAPRLFTLRFLYEDELINEVFVLLLEPLKTLYLNAQPRNRLLILL